MDFEVIDLDSLEEWDGDGDVAMRGDIGQEDGQGKETAGSDSSTEFLPNPGRVCEKSLASSHAQAAPAIRKEDVVSSAAVNPSQTSRNQHRTAETVPIPAGVQDAELESHPEANETSRTIADVHHACHCIPCNKACSDALAVLEHVATAQKDRQNVYCCACAALFFSLTAFNNYLDIHGRQGITAAVIPIADYSESSAILYYCAICHEFRASMNAILEHRRSWRDAEADERQRKPGRYSTIDSRWVRRQHHK